MTPTNIAIAIAIFVVGIYLIGKLGFFQDKQETKRDRMNHEHNEQLGTSGDAKSAREQY